MWFHLLNNTFFFSSRERAFLMVVLVEITCGLSYSNATEGSVFELVTLLAHFNELVFTLFFLYEFAWLTCASVIQPNASTLVKLCSISNPIL